MPFVYATATRVSLHIACALILALNAGFAAVSGDTIQPPQSTDAPLMVYVEMRDGSNRCGMFDPITRTISFRMGGSTAKITLDYRDVLRWAVPTSDQIEAAKPKARPKKEKSDATATTHIPAVNADPTDAKPAPARQEPQSTEDNSTQAARRQQLAHRLVVLYEVNATPDMDLLALRAMEQQARTAIEQRAEDHQFLCDKLKERFSVALFSQTPPVLPSLGVLEKIRDRCYDAIKKVKSGDRLESVFSPFGLVVVERQGSCLELRWDYACTLPVRPAIILDVDVSINKQTVVRLHRLGGGTTEWSSVKYLAETRGARSAELEIEDFLKGQYQESFAFRIYPGTPELDHAETNRVTRQYSNANTTFAAVPSSIVWEMAPRLQKETGVMRISWKVGETLIVEKAQTPATTPAEK